MGRKQIFKEKVELRSKSPCCAGGPGIAAKDQHGEVRNFLTNYKTLKDVLVETS